MGDWDFFWGFVAMGILWCFVERIDWLERGAEGGKRLLMYTVVGYLHTKNDST